MLKIDSFHLNSSAVTKRTTKRILAVFTTVSIALGTGASALSSMNAFSPHRPVLRSAVPSHAIHLPKYLMVELECSAILFLAVTSLELQWITEDAERMRSLSRSTEDLSLRVEDLSQKMVDLEQEREKERRKSEAKDNQLAMVSHELRNPLAAILGFVNFLKEPDLTQDESKLALDSIERNAAILDKLVLDLTDSARINTNKLSLSEAEINLEQLVVSAVKSMKFRAKGKNIFLSAQTNFGERPFVGDEVRLQQVLWNLLGNAIKFTPPGGTIKVRGLRDESAVVIVVEDSGIGLTPDQIEYVFQRHWQASHQKGSLGLGLFIAHHIVELHGGNIVAASDGPGRGTTFTVTLPV